MTTSVTSSTVNYPTAKCRTISTTCMTNWLRRKSSKKTARKRLGPTPTTLGRRIGKGRLKTSQEVSDDLENHTRFVWGRQPPLAGSPPGRQTYLYLYRSRFLRAFSASPRPDQRRRRKPTTDPLFPLRPHRHPKRDDR